MTFDPYHKWLGIPTKDQPPNHYRLLAIDLYESDPEVIDAAANRQMVYLQQRATGEHAALSQKLLNEISAARLCLLNPKKKAEYDTKLKEHLKETRSSDKTAEPDLLADELLTDVEKKARGGSSRESPRLEPWHFAVAAGCVALAVIGFLWFFLPPPSPDSVAHGDGDISVKEAPQSEESQNSIGANQQTAEVTTEQPDSDVAAGTIPPQTGSPGSTLSSEPARDVPAIEGERPPTLVKAGNLALASNGTTVEGPHLGASAINDGEVGPHAKVRIGRPCVFTFSQTYHLRVIRLKLWDDGERGYRYKLEVSEDGRNYELVGQKVWGLWQGWQTHEFAARPVRYLRLIGTHNPVGDGIRIEELEAYSTYSRLSQAEGLSVVDEATDKPTTEKDGNVVLASRGAVVRGQVGRPEALNDGNLEETWRTYTKAPRNSPITLVLPEIHRLAVIRMKLSGDHPYRYDVRVSPDGDKYVVVADRTTGDWRGWQEIEFPPRPVISIRITCTYPHHICIDELEAYCRRP